MADYKHGGFDTYGYVEEIQFTPLLSECGVTYQKSEEVDEKLDMIESIVSQDMVEQGRLDLPKCKCLRK